jgi:hypothetical protein
VKYEWSVLLLLAAWQKRACMFSKRFSGTAAFARLMSVGVLLVQATFQRIQGATLTDFSAAGIKGTRFA